MLERSPPAPQNREASVVFFLFPSCEFSFERLIFDWGMTILSAFQMALWLPGDQIGAGGTWIYKVPPSKIGENLSKAHDQEKAIRLGAPPTRDECAHSVPEDRADHHSICGSEVHQRLQWFFELRLNGPLCEIGC